MNKTYKKYDNRLTKEAKRMRNNPTQPEKMMWDSLLKHRNLTKNYMFTRQKPISSFIVDFYCSELFLAIEIDGSNHKDKEEYDKERTIELAKENITVIRFTNEQVLYDIKMIKKSLNDEISHREKGQTLPPDKGEMSLCDKGGCITKCS